MDPDLFNAYIDFADSLRLSQPNVYFFLKNCYFLRIFHENGNSFPNDEIKNMCLEFKSEMDKNNWNESQLTKSDYQMFLDNGFKQIDFQNVSLEDCLLLKLITENLGIFGNFDGLTSKRIHYFNKKIEKLKQNQPNKANFSTSIKHYFIPLDNTKSKKNDSIPSISPQITDNIIAVNFMSSDQLINYPIGGLKTDNFSTIEEKLFNEFPELRNKSIYFITNGNIIDRTATLEQNNIKSGNSILIEYN